MDPKTKTEAQALIAKCDRKAEVAQACADVPRGRHIEAYRDAATEASAEAARLRALLPTLPDEAPHVCENCDGGDPASCVYNPSRS